MAWYDFFRKRSSIVAPAPAGASTDPAAAAVPIPSVAAAGAMPPPVADMASVSLRTFNAFAEETRKATRTLKSALDGAVRENGKLKGEVAELREDYVRLEGTLVQRIEALERGEKPPANDPSARRTPRP